ncbi:MAG: nuclear transport factor 2 family protein [Bacteroidales bacterium]|nr:nuclear transport factor 2 family protein [Bacteroidales bacterium]
MKSLFILSLCAFMTMPLAGQATGEKEAIIKVIGSAYVEGIQNAKEIENISKGFHPGFNLLGIDQAGNLTMLPIYTWEASIKRGVEAGRTPAVQTTAKYPMIDITGSAAIAKVELYREGKQIFTDYLSLYKFPEGWRIVSKIYYRIPD